MRVSQKIALSIFNYVFDALLAQSSACFSNKVILLDNSPISIFVHLGTTALRPYPFIPLLNRIHLYPQPGVFATFPLKRVKVRVSHRWLLRQHDCLAG